MSDDFTGRVAILQHWLAPYRVPFFDLLASRCTGGLSIAAGHDFEGRPSHANELRVARFKPLVNRRWLPGRFEFVTQQGVADWLDGWKPDVLVATINPRMLSVPRACRWMRRHGGHVIGWGLGGMAVQPGLAMSLRRMLRRPLLRRFDRVIAYGTRASHEYAAMGFPVNRIAIAFNSTRYRPAGPPPLRPDSFVGRPRIAFVGQVSVPKRIDLLLHACAAMPPDRSPELVVVGDGPARADAERLAATLHPQTRFIGDLRGEALSAVLNEVDLFVLPGMGGLAIQEAMAHALPAIVAEGDGTQFDLIRPENGWHVRPNDLDHLVSTMREALTDPKRLRRMGEASYRIVREQINVQTMVDTFISVLRGLDRR
jgi:glycosyltransferase involved in cell wall biosynthesis